MLTIVRIVGVIGLATIITIGFWLAARIVVASMRYLTFRQRRLDALLKERETWDE